MPDLKGLSESDSGINRIDRLLKQLREAAEPGYDEIDLTKVPAEKRAETKSDLEKLGVVFVAEPTPNYWEVRWDSKGGRHHEIERIKAVATPGGIDDELDDLRAELEHAASSEKRGTAVWDYSTDTDDDRLYLDGLTVEFTWKNGALFTAEEIMSALDRWSDDHKPLTLTKYVTYESEGDRWTRSYSWEGTASVILTSKNTKVTVKQPGVYEFYTYEERVRAYH